MKIRNDLKQNGLRRNDGLPKLNIKNCRESIKKNYSTKIVGKNKYLPKR